MSSRLKIYESALLTDLAMCINHYRMHTPGLNAVVCVEVQLPSNQSVPVDIAAQVNYGPHKQCTVPDGGAFFIGAPNLIVDLYRDEEKYKQRLVLFAEAGVQEYACVTNGETLMTRWNRLVDGTYQPIDMDASDTLMSEALPGLWIPKPALCRRDWWSILAAIDQGVTRKPHHEFMQTIWQ